jgi:hypothetical protein
MKESLIKGYWQTPQAEPETDAPQIGHGQVLRRRAVAVSYSGHRYPVEVISHAVWLYFRVRSAFREVE